MFSGGTYCGDDVTVTVIGEWVRRAGPVVHAVISWRIAGRH